MMNDKLVKNWNCIYVYNSNYLGIHGNFPLDNILLSPHRNEAFILRVSELIYSLIGISSEINKYCSQIPF